MKETINLKPIADLVEISDGYHTFTELYDHRIALYIALCKNLVGIKDLPIWRSKRHNDGSTFDGWFILGLYCEPGKQITYHIPIKYWEQTEWAETRDHAPMWDKHTSADVLERIKQL